MKRYISVILIPCFLLQLFGCYSSEEISLDELENRDEAIITTKSDVEYHLKRNLNNQEVINNPDIYFSNSWLIKPNAEMITLIILKPYLEDKGELNIWHIRFDTTKINYDELSNVSIESFSIGKTCLGFGLILVGIAGVILIITGISGFGFNWR